ncbi:MAG: HAD family hydrolase [Planctomycetaceae bacterium]
MPKSLLEYADWLDGRDLVWPRAPVLKAPTAGPKLESLNGIRAVLWNIYGTLLRIADGRLIFLHPQQIRMQVALEKTAREFNMWNSMYRTPGAPWEYLFARYRKALEHQELGRYSPGDSPEVNSTTVWKTIIRELKKKDYQYDVAFYGDIDGFSEKVAYFFQASLQGLAAEHGALEAVLSVSQAGLKQGLFGDAQPFTPVQMLRAFRAASTLPPPIDLFAAECSVLSYQEGLRMPSRSLFSKVLARFARLGIEPGEILHVSSRAQPDLAAAQKAGMRTAFYARGGPLPGAPGDESDEPPFEPDCILTDLNQLRQVLSAG